MNILLIFFELFITFFKIGLFTIGGGYAMIPLIQQEIIDHGWMTLAELIDIIAISEMTPGPFAVNAATFVGIKTTGLAGGLFATLGVTFPSFVIVVLVARYFTHFQNHPIVQSVLYGLRPAVIGLIASSAFLIGKAAFLNASVDFGSLFADLGRFFTETVDWKAILIFGAVIFGKYKFNIHPVLLIVISAALGVVLYGLL